MARIVPLALIGAIAVLGAACSDSTSTTQDALDVDAAFVSTPTGFASTSNSFSSDTSGFSSDTVRRDSARRDSARGDSTRDGYRHGGRRGGRGGDHGRRGPNGLLHGFDFMGGGLRLDFLGGPRDGRRPFDFGGNSGNCATAGGVTTCTSTHRGLTVTRTLAFTSASGATQTAFDSSTNTVRARTTVSGTTTRRDSVTAVVSHASDQTVSGLARGSTQRTVSGTSAGTENLAGKDSAGVAFTAIRAIGDTIVGIVIPVQTGRHSYPTAGTVTRSLRVSVTSAGTTKSSSRREVITYDGSSTARLVITQDGTTRTCTLPLPHGRPTCQ
ncbi:MAG TPA: hypothetical protein VF584_08995 [Longimicrobium sp.]|jgi:hypothetical protein